MAVSVDQNGVLAAGDFGDLLHAEFEQAAARTFVCVQDTGRNWRRRMATTAPATATPSAPPNERMKAEAEVAAPEVGPLDRILDGDGEVRHDESQSATQADQRRFNQGRRLAGEGAPGQREKAAGADDQPITGKIL